MPIRHLKPIRKGKGVFPIPEILERSAWEFGSKVAMRIQTESGERKYTYEDLLRYVSRVAHYLTTLGFKPANKGAILSENRPEWGIAYFSILWAGGVVVPLDSRASSHEWFHILNHSESDIIFVSKTFLPDILDIKENLKTLRHVIPLDPSPPSSDINYIMQTHTTTMACHRYNLDDLAVILYTSGTTGSSKGVMLSHKNIMSNVEAMYSVIDYEPEDRFFSVLPLHHVFEGTCGLLAALYHGVEIYYARSLKPRELREDLINAQATIFLVVPLILEKLVLGLQREIRHASLLKKSLFYSLKGIQEILSPLGKNKTGKILWRRVREMMGFGKARYIISGGAALPEWVSQVLENLGFPILQGYGLSESAPVLTVNPPEAPRNKSVGWALPNVEIEIFNPDENGIGEIIARGPNIMLGYYKNPKATEETLRDGWLFTGDMGYIDKDGYLYIVGRKKSVIVTKGGKNIYPEEIEEILSQSPFIQEILVLMGEHPLTKEEELQAIIYPDYTYLEAWAKENKIELTEDKIYRIIEEEIEKFSRVLPPIKRPKRFRLRETEFPKTTTQKIKRYLFEKPLWEVKEE